MKIQTFEQACELLKISTNLPDLSAIPESFQRSILATYKLQVIIQAQNESYQFDWANYKELKSYPWFYLEMYKDDTPGVGFRFLGGGVSAYDGSGVGSRLCLRTAADAKHIGKTFIDLYREMMLQ